MVVLSQLAAFPGSAAAWVIFQAWANNEQPVSYLLVLPSLPVFVYYNNLADSLSVRYRARVYESSLLLKTALSLLVMDLQ